MSPEWGLAYAAAFFLQALLPGPAVMFIVGTALSHGKVPAIAVGIGLSIGDVLLAAFALAGLSAAIATGPSLWTALEFAAAAYLVALGVRLWRAPPEQGPAMARPGTAGGVARGAMLALTNPRAVAAHASLLPLAAKGGSPGPLGAATILAIVLSINIAILGAYAFASLSAGRLFSWSGGLGMFNKAAAGAMVLSAATLIFHR